MEIRYHSTRDKESFLTASQAILKGLADDGGLFVPERMPEALEIPSLMEKNYQGIALEVMSRFFTDFTQEELTACIDGAYDSKFDTEEIAPLAEIGGTYYLELFHGATIAFKDMALSILPLLMTTAAKKQGLKEEIVILTATSGDTGKAAMAGFADVPGTRIMVFYPKDGVSPVQEKQMLTQKGGNVKVVGIRGNFDDAQSGVKRMFGDETLREELKKKGFVFSSANSINIGRLIPQVAYYVYSYVQLLKYGRIGLGEPVNFCVPTGNFGNILAAYYATQLGIPVHKLICASNSNRVLYDFFHAGTYDKLHELDLESGAFSQDREFMLTGSPSMDILISSNLERLIYHISGEDTEKTAALMKSLSQNGAYEIDDAMRSELEVFESGFANEARTARAIRETYEKHSYVIDPHTAVAAAVYEDYFGRSGDDHSTVIASTASPYKFARTVMNAIDPSSDVLDDMELIDKLNAISGVELPRAIEELKGAPILHDTVCDIDEMPSVVRGFLQ